MKVVDRVHIGSDPSGQLDVLGHDGDELAGLLQGHHGGALEAQVGLKSAGRSRGLDAGTAACDQELGGLLVPGAETFQTRKQSIFIHEVDLTKCFRFAARRSSCAALKPAR